MNKQKGIWVDIIYHKYGACIFWTNGIHSDCSWFYRGLCHTARIIKANCWNPFVNSMQTSFLFDPWYYEILVAFKPTYLNIEENFESLHISDLILDTH